MKKTKTKKKLTTLALSLIVTLTFSIGVFAITTGLEYLHQLEAGKPIYYESYVEKTELFPTDGDQTKIITIGESKTPIFWHFVDPSAQGFIATIVFSDSKGNTFTVEKLESYKQGRHYGVITPSDFKIENAWLVGESNDKNFMFNLSHVATTPTTTSTTTKSTTTKPTTTSTTTPTTTQETTVPTTTGNTTQQTTTQTTTNQTTTETITITETSIPLVSVTTTTPTTTIPYDKIPKTGEAATNLPTIGLSSIMAGALLLFAKRIFKNK